MKMVIAYFQPYMAERVVSTLQGMPEVPGATLVEATGFGRGRGKREQTAPTTEIAQFGMLRKMRLEVMIPDELEDRVVQAIREAAHTGDYGDGKIYVTALDRALRIRTGEEGAEAL